MFTVVVFFFSFQALPVCTSHNSLCDVTFDIPSMGIPDFSEPICECPGKDSCAAAKNDPGRTYTQEMISPGKYESHHDKIARQTHIRTRRNVRKSCIPGETALRQSLRAKHVLALNVYLYIVHSKGQFDLSVLVQ